MTKISVIVPVYNVEKYLDRCIQSVLSQTYTNFELLLINDGSTDSSGVVCDKYAKMDSRVRVFHKQNGGLSSARNVGISNALGEYVIFLDSDDYWMSSLALNNLLECAILNNADIVRGELCYVDEDEVFLWDNRKNTKEKYANIVLSNASFINRIVCREWWVCVSLYKSTILQEFDETQNFQEDIDFHIRIFTQKLKCLYLPIVFYAYRIRLGSSTNSIKQSNLYYSFRLCHTFMKYSSLCYEDKLSLVYQHHSIMMYYWTLCTLSEFFYQRRLQIISDNNLYDLQKMVASLAKGNVLKYPIPIFINPNLGCWTLSIYIKLKKKVRNSINKIFRR